VYPVLAVKAQIQIVVFVSHVQTLADMAINKVLIASAFAISNATKEFILVKVLS